MQVRPTKLGVFYKLSALKRGIHSVPIYGGQSYDRQIRALKQGVQIVIGTPAEFWIISSGERSSSIRSGW